MKTRVITAQAECLRVLLDNDMLGELKPSHPDAPGCLGMFPIGDPLTTATFCIADKKGERWELVILSEITLEEAITQFELVSRRLAASRHATLHLFPQSEPANN